VYLSSLALFSLLCPSLRVLPRPTTRYCLFRLVASPAIPWHTKLQGHAGWTLENAKTQPQKSKQLLSSNHRALPPLLRSYCVRGCWSGKLTSCSRLPEPETAPRLFAFPFQPLLPLSSSSLHTRPKTPIKRARRFTDWPIDSDTASYWKSRVIGCAVSKELHTPVSSSGPYAVPTRHQKGIERR
jgi:hypothetical protein